ncbi:hypothetical protein [Sphingobacterium paucimobilis]|uniref:Uncharacterized protein n=1 Tax=Sphingobacterium paucimobilis HER1398 TaxID=1346330 RepID=U2J202_9SPHI|nr:hypothetical protein [Sphingobacterium paucimobilis]ERJ58989.1 hypothetical protein M472_09425 [Sphingobacterium paucimobilis HER1398]
MSKYQIFEIENYAINAVKEDRLALSITQKELARTINDNEESNFVGVAESNKNTTTYNVRHLQQFASLFNHIASQKTDEELFMLGARRNYHFTDYLPDKALNDILVEKNIVFIPNRLKASGALILLSEAKDKFIENWHTVREFCDYANSCYMQSWETSHFSSALEYAVKQGKFEKQETAVLFRKATLESLNLK